MENQKKSNTAVFIGLGIALVLALVITVIAVSDKDEITEHNFIYSEQANRGYQQDYVTYEVSNGSLQEVIFEYDVDRRQHVRRTSGGDADSSAVHDNLYVYDIKTDGVEAVFFSEIRDKKLSGSSVSPDGFSVSDYSCGRGPRGFFFEVSREIGGHNRDSNRCLLKSGSEEHTLSFPGSYNYRSTFLAWIIE